MTLPCLLRAGALGLVLSMGLDTTNVQAAETSLQLCLGEAADHSLVYVTQRLYAPVKETLAVFWLGPGESFKTLTSTWIAIDVGKAAPPHFKIAEATLSLNGVKTGKFRYSQPNPLPVGKYRLEVKADGKPWQSVEFSIVAAPQASPVTRPESLLPLSNGQVWTYAFVQEAGEGAKIDLPGVTPDADGKLRATVTMTVAETDAAGSRIESRRNNTLVFQEWWQLGHKGLAATQRKTDEAFVVLNPPQIFWQWPLTTPAIWEYHPQDKSYKQTYRMWGPVPIKGPTGEAPGYVVLVEQPSPLVRMTVERHFLPGVGLVREVLISAIGDKIISRQELVLKQ